MASVSVIIPVYNGKKFIGKAVETALSQTFHDIEIIIVDDASVDGTGEELVTGYKRLIGNKITYYKNDRNRERAFSRNKGYELSGGEYIFFLDMVGHVEDRKVAGALEELQTHCQFLKVLGSYPKAKSESQKNR